MSQFPILILSFSIIMTTDFAWFSLVRADEHTTESGSLLQTVEIPDSVRYWQKSGYHQLYPAVKLPTGKSREERIQIWARLPEDRQITTTFLKDQDRYTLSFPAGTEIDRVECIQDSTNNCRVKDVRGTRVLEGGVQRYHILKPFKRDSKRLVGYEWNAGDEKAREIAIDKLSSQLARVYRPSVENFQQQCNFFSNCSVCHTPNKKRKLRKSRLPLRQTDASGFYVPLTVLNDASVSSPFRPIDRNVEDPYIEVQCGARSGWQVSRADEKLRFICGDKTQPVLERNFERALAGGDPYTRKVCDSRWFLFNHMDSNAKAAFSTALAGCVTKKG